MKGIREEMLEAEPAGGILLRRRKDEKDRFFEICTIVIRNGGTTGYISRHDKNTRI